MASTPLGIRLISGNIYSYTLLSYTSNSVRDTTSLKSRRLSEEPWVLVFLAARASVVFGIHLYVVLATNLLSGHRRTAIIECPLDYHYH